MTGKQDGQIAPNPGLGDEHTDVQTTDQSNSKLQSMKQTMSGSMKSKAPILTVAMGLMTTAGEMLTSGSYIEGGLLLVTGIGCVALYEHQQVKQLPEPVDETMIEESVDKLAEQLEQRLAQSNTDDKNNSDTNTEKSNDSPAAMNN